MKLNEVAWSNPRQQRPNSGQKSGQTITVGLMDPRTEEWIDVELRGNYQYDTGDVGFGVGPGKSPYPSEWELDYVDVAEPFEFMGRRYKEGQIIEIDDFKQYMEDHVAKTIFDGGPEDTGDGGY
jgi:hypothetical protein